MDKIKCLSCGKGIDEDSRFCKYCGKRIVDQHVKAYNEDKLVRIFSNIYKTRYTYSDYSKEEFDDKFSAFKSYEKRMLSDNDYYRIIVDIIFYSGFRASTVDKYIENIHRHFPDYKTVCNYSLSEIEIIKRDPNMIRNKSKIDACVHNAMIVSKLVDKYGTVKNYIESFHPNSSDDALYKLKRSLESNFSYLGGVTSYHFLTDIGLNVLKPDRVILRIFYRLGLIDNEKDLIGAVKVGRAFSEATNLPIRYIDIIFVSYGQLNQDKIECICSEINPKCNKCGVRSECSYVKGLKQITS